MSQRHSEAFRAIRREHDDVVVALKAMSGTRKRGAPGVPSFDAKRLEDAVITAGDAYALLLIATAEGFLREYLRSIGLGPGVEPRLGILIDRCFRELNARSSARLLRSDDRQAMHGLRMNRNDYAHGHRTRAFPGVAVVEEIVSRFLAPFPN